MQAVVGAGSDSRLNQQVVQRSQVDRGRSAGAVAAGTAGCIGTCIEGSNSAVGLAPQAEYPCRWAAPGPDRTVPVISSI